MLEEGKIPGCEAGISGRVDLVGQLQLKQRGLH